MSRIIKPMDTITLTIDNRTNPVKVDMQTSSNLPIPFVINMFANLIAQLSAQLAQAMSAGVMPPGVPPGKTEEKPGGSSNGNT